jgi:hypothetical protein
MPWEQAVNSKASPNLSILPIQGKKNSQQGSCALAACKALEDHIKVEHTCCQVKHSMRKSKVFTLRWLHTYPNKVLFHASPCIGTRPETTQMLDTTGRHQPHTETQPGLVSTLISTPRLRCGALAAGSKQLSQAIFSNPG